MDERRWTSDEKSYPNEIGKSRHLTGQENIENKANVDLGKIDVSSSLTSKYERF
jgi:hypothetical protein